MSLELRRTLNKEKFQVARHEAEDLARQLGLPYVECSAKLRKNVDQAFHDVVRLVR